MVTELDLADLSARLARWGVSSVEPLSGGASSLTYRGQRDGRAVVAKVAPPGLPPVRHRDVLRQARILRALGPTEVPVPDVLVSDPGDPPEVPPLFVMTMLPGDSIEPLFDPDMAGPVPPDGPGPPDGPTMAARLAAAAEVMASLHRLDPGPAGLGLQDEPVVDGAGEIDRWCALLATVDPALVAGWEDVAAALRARLPAFSAPALVHGDFRLGNLLADGPQITAVIDWEIWSVGDPRIDVGWFLANADPDTYRRPTIYAAPGVLPGPAALNDIYRRALDRPAAAIAQLAQPADLDWFVALARFKSAATWSLIIKHNRRRPAPDPDVEAMAPVLGRLLEQAGGAVG
jgi:aminoglycoside phosphotransferase (APT) family kinase protein